MSQVDWPIIQKLKLWRVTKNEGYILRHRVRSLWPTYLGGQHLPKHVEQAAHCVMALPNVI